MRTEVERADERDVAAWLRLAAEVELLFEAPLSTDPAFEHGLRKGIARGTAVVVRNPDMAGPLWGGATWSPAKRMISWLAVAREARGKGLGRALLLRVLEELGPGEVTVITFTADSAEGLPARRLYEAMGFTNAGLDRDWLPLRRDRYVRSGESDHTHVQDREWS